MGMMDRDYMKDRQRQRPFSPPPERSGTSTLLIALFFVAALVALYKVADWKLNQRTTELAAKKATAEAAEIKHTTEVRPPPVDQPFPALPNYQNTPATSPDTRSVSKCVVNGKTSYSDGSCTQGAVATQVTTRANHNLMAAIHVPVAAQPETPIDQASVVAQNNPSMDAAAKKAECQYLNAEIERLDAMARQPQSGQTQDWIKAERKQLRDRQYRIPCQ